ncbi:probable s-acyltransferase at3g09320-like [Stylonychia lemnae]|uniref:Palmitoyltransferase n=1 Tax=Stylonychia lemnae TaxID=5949 RepID=A0A078B877_STYLE|nr:probable s-acyltransferase at3g09320-like [Stylonychia lemnae]|eukprot:CDW90386.1 probable s-acyltransferase at3g09320-like [Stylonychia lemnae]
MCMTCHKILKRVIGKNQKLDVFVWSMRAIVIFLNVLPFYNMNYMGDTDKSKYCMACRNWKPDRSHHCSICGICVLKQDHHCPWLGNCVGYHNFKEFFLFCFYQMMIGVIYTTQLIRFGFYRPDEDTHDLSMLGTIFYYITNILAVPIAFALIFLSLSVFIQIYNNITGIERMSYVQLKQPCFGISKSQAMCRPNEYDMIWLPNIKQVLGPHMWMWLLPISYEMKGKGFYYPKVPEITMSDLNILLKDVSRVHGTSFTINDFESDPKEYIQKAIQKYSGSKFLIHKGQTKDEDQIVEVPSLEEQKSLKKEQQE